MVWNIYIYLLLLFMWIIVDIFEYMVKYMLCFNLISISGYYMYEVGVMVDIELVYILGDGLQYICVGL